MGLSSFPSAAEGVLPVLVLFMVLMDSLLKSAIHITTTTWGWASSTATGNQVVVDEITTTTTGSGGAATAYFKCLHRVCHNQSSVAGGGWTADDECSVCLSEYEDGEEVSELGCKHLFHTSCLDKWFHNRHSTCPLCRSIL